jgi:hypothetical protein
MRKSFLLVATVMAVAGQIAPAGAQGAVSSGMISGHGKRHPQLQAQTVRPPVHNRAVATTRTTDPETTGSIAKKPN